MALNKNAKKWVKALRSRKYKQTTQILYQDGKFCCLGVACDLAVKAGVISEPEKQGMYRVYDGQENVLPKRVQKWLGLSTTTGSFTYKGEDADLTTLNDEERMTFGQIARVIESEPEGLFTK